MSAYRPLAALAFVLAFAAFAPANAAAFSQPEQLRSKNGVLRATFTAAPGAAKINGKLTHGTYTYNGQYVGPTLNVRPGIALS